MGRLRIVAGALKGRRIRVPDSRGVRPTPERAREALFDILGHDLSGLRVLDAFAGTGALGLEALSRGAAHVTFVEADRTIAEALRQTLASLDVEGRCRVLVARADENALALARGPFDVVVADPPYADAEARDRFLRGLASVAGILTSGARIAVERESRGGPPSRLPSGLVLSRTTIYGRTTFDFFSPSRV